MATVERGEIVTAIFAPGITLADAAITMPVYYPEIKEIMGGILLAGQDGTPDTWTATTLTAEVLKVNQTADYISNVDGNTLRCGTATAASDLLVLVYRSY